MSLILPVISEAFKACFETKKAVPFSERLFKKQKK